RTGADGAGNGVGNRLPSALGDRKRLIAHEPALLDDRAAADYSKSVSRGTLRPEKIPFKRNLGRPVGVLDVDGFSPHMPSLMRLCTHPLNTLRRHQPCDGFSRQCWS